MVQLAGREITGWTTANVSAGIERMPRSFSLGLISTLDTALGDIEHALPIQQLLEVYLVHDNGNQDKVLTGYVDLISDNISDTEHALEYGGRGVCQDIVDCSSEIFGKPANELNGLPVNQVVTQLVEPYGIEVVVENDNATKPYNGLININVGDDCYSTIEQISRYVSCLVYENAYGDLVLGSPGSETPSQTVLSLGDMRVKSCKVTLDSSQMYSDYWVYTQGQASLLEIFGTQPTGKHHDTMFDNRKNAQGGTRYRKKRLIKDLLLSPAIYKTSESPQQIYADWLGWRSNGRSQAVNVTVAGWTDAQDQLWTPNSLVTVLLPLQGYPKPTQLLISECSYGMALDGGTTTTMTLMPANAFGVEPTQSTGLGPDLVAAATGTNAPASTAAPHASDAI
jgi:prophage tail gpP-like protein